MEFRKHIFDPAFERQGAFGNDRLNYNHGTNIPEDNDEVDVYIVAYGPGHYQKLGAAFKSIKLATACRGDIELIDWGCGVALGAWTFLKTLHDNDLDVTAIKRVTLIDPSWHCLVRGTKYLGRLALSTEASFRNLNVVNKKFGSLVDTDLIANESSLKIHIFSNVLDMELVSLGAMHKRIVRNFPGRNLFVVTSPLNMQRINAFYQLFRSTHKIEKEWETSEPVRCWRYRTNSRMIEEDGSVQRFEKLFVIENS